MAKRIILYCRESRDESGQFFGRIEAQRDILLRFIRERGIEGDIEIILDDNVSGTDFSRLDGVAKRAREGQLDLIVFKDASRLGRNLRECLNFLHLMDQCGVEVLFESEAYDPELFPLLAWFNERRAAEDSRKVRRVFRHRIASGELVFRAPYGYRREGKGLAPDPAAAAVVRRIFSLYLEGYSTGDIAALLNREQIPTPSAHPGRGGARQALQWNAQHIRRILSERAYTGDMCYQKTIKPSYKSKKILRNPPERWIIAQNHHEALVPRQWFLQAADIAARRQKTGAPPEKLRFAGILYCGGCGAKMVQRRRQGRPAAYVCGAYQRGGKSACASHHIRESLLLKAAGKLLAPLARDPRLPRAVSEALASKTAENSGAQRLVEQYERAVMRIYDDMLSRPDDMPRQLYEAKLAEYSAKLNAAKRTLAAQPAGAPEEARLADWLTRVPYLERAALHRLFARISFFLPGEGAESLSAPVEKKTIVFTLRE